jgi:hypothetical protein
MTSRCPPSCATGTPRGAKPSTAHRRRPAAGKASATPHKTSGSGLLPDLEGGRLHAARRLPRQARQNAGRPDDPTDRACFLPPNRSDFAAERAAVRRLEAAGSCVTIAGPTTRCSILTPATHRNMGRDPHLVHNLSTRRFGSAGSVYGFWTA